jgi:hypothetical protein
MLGEYVQRTELLHNKVEHNVDVLDVMTVLL